MKRAYVIILFMLVASFMLVAAENDVGDANDVPVNDANDVSETVDVVEDNKPTTSVTEKDVEKLQGIIGQLPFEESGETNFSKYKPFVSKAEERIDGINTWLDDNAGWMRYIFYMRPQVSILFTLNVYFILLFLLVLVLNAEGLWFFIETESRARIFGGAVFVVFAAAGLYVGLAHVANNFISYVWEVLVPTGFWMAMIAMVILLVVAIFAFPVIGSLIKMIAQYRDAKKKTKQAMETATNTEAFNKMIGEVINKKSS